MSALTQKPVVLRDYEDVRVRRGRRSGLTVAVAVHRTVNGRSLGGCRMKPYASPDDAVRDVERLARAMSFKAAVAGLQLGGAKGVIALDPTESLTDELRRDALHDFAELVESFEGRYITAQDVGISAEDIAFMEQFTDHVAGRPAAEGGCGDPSPYTAHGVEVAIRASLGSRTISGAHIVIIGLGHVGGALAQRLRNAGAKLTLSDVDQGKRELAQQLWAEWAEPGEAMKITADLLAPCALGGILTPESVAELRVPVIAGAANNQLSDESVADLLSDRGIVWAPDFVVNAAGLIAVADELHGFDPERAERSIAGIGHTLRQIYARAAAGKNTLLAAKELAAERSGIELEESDGDHV
ncbi:MAG TPA: Glu/Leu/Phe/Val dehydrogenase dimerization domain-containing protein [Solirubrobacteraceae bacterium]|nr:Glu/Leu/Phe/Val dehydrogenase dimerization domain-containing protein [Solirubrobacteraceae bacterium]